jgi:hypothetical protein
MPRKQWFYCPASVARQIGTMPSSFTWNGDF